MKKLIYTFAFAMIGLVAVSAQEIAFEQDVIDYGEITQGDNGSKVFTFKNTGDKPLILSRVKPTCGCTIAEYPKEPIAPGESGEIKVGYDTKRLNAFNKTIEVHSNAVESGRKILRIKGKILPKAGAVDKKVPVLEKKKKTALKKKVS